MSSTFIIGETRRVLASMPDASVDLVMSSPPFLALRSYLPADHPDKALEIGSESGPGEFLDVLLDVVEECARVLTPHGSLVFELGDTYSGTGGSTDNRDSSLGGNDMAPRPSRSGRSGWHRLGQRGEQPDQPPNYRKDGTISDSDTAHGGDGWPLDKSLCMIPSSFAWALAYGRNPWTGRETDPWRIRNLVAWCRPNPPVGSLGDKFRPGTSYLTVACKSRKRWFDLEAVRGPGSPNTHARLAERVRETTGSQRNRGKSADDENRGGNWSTFNTQDSDGTAPPLDWWEIPTQPFPGAHYATFPEKLVVRPIEAMCPRQVCRQCGEPRRRLFDVGYVDSHGNPAPKGEWKSGVGEGKGAHSLKTEVRTTTTTTTGWSDCGHDDWRRGVVLDPFAGSGTTLAVAEGHGRDSIGIDLDARNADLARARCGEMFLTVETSTEAVA